MNMSVSASGSSALREYQKPAGAGAAKAATGAAQQTLSAPIDGKNASAPPGFDKLSDKTRQAPSLNSAYEDIDIKELNANLTAMEQHLLAMQEYGSAMSKRAEEHQLMMQEFLGKMGRELGSAMMGTAIPNDPLGPEPVRTTSGGVHPQSERIKDYIRAHKNEWDNLSSPEPSFEEWQKTRG